MAILENMIQQARQTIENLRNSEEDKSEEIKVWQTTLDKLEAEYASFGRSSDTESDADPAPGSQPRSPRSNG